MNIEQRLIEGIISASDKTWRYRKDLLEIRPEYLLTVATADALTNGFEDVSGLDVQITIEARTRDVCFEVMKGAVGLKETLSAGKRLNLTRKGRIDIFVTHERRSWVIELKGFDPQRDQIDKEIRRFIEILSVNDWSNNCEGCFLAFPMRYQTDHKAKAIVNAGLSGFPLTAQYTLKSHDTEEDPEYGIPGFKIIVVKISRDGAKPYANPDAEETLRRQPRLADPAPVSVTVMPQRS